MAAQADPMYPLAMSWFRAGAWYTDAITTLVLTLPDDDPALAQVLDSIRSGTMLENEVVARNVLRFDMAAEEIKAFMMSKIESESMLLYARVLVQDSVRPPDPKPSAGDFYAAVFKLFLTLFRWLPQLMWWLVKARLGRQSFIVTPNFYATVFKAKVGASLFVRGSLTDRWRAALHDPLWWLALGAIGTLVFL